MEKVMKLVEKYLKKNREEVVCDLRITKYGTNNFYLGILYNKKIDMYKVLYIPLDLIDGGKVKDFCCYQFIDLMSVNYILSSLKEKADEYQDVSFRENVNESIDNYKVEININIDSCKYTFKTTRYIPKSWIFMFDMIVTMFGYAPNIVSGVCEDLLTLYKDEAEDIKWQESFKFDLLRDDDDVLFKIFGRDVMDFKKISFLERINNKYYSIINKRLVIVEYEAGITNTYCIDSEYNEEVLTVIMAIRENEIKKFSKIMLLEENSHKVKFYLVYGLDKKGLQVIHGAGEEVIPYELYDEGYIKFKEDDNNFEKEIKKKKN